MSAVALGVAAALVSLRCQLITDDPYVLGSVSRVIPSTRPAFLQALNATRRLIGCPVEEDVEPPGPPFTGGQCPCSIYRRIVTLTGNNPTSGVAFTTTSDRRARGPIGPLTFPQPGEARTSDRGSASFSSGNTPACQATTQFGSLIFPANPTNFQSSITVTLLSGPDNCGDPPPQDYPPPIDRTTNIDVTYNIDNGDEVTVNIPFVFAPITANFDGSLRIPFTFELGGINFNGDINLPDFDVTIEPPKITPGSDDDTTPVGEDEPGETIPPAPPDEKIIGVVVNATDTESGRVSAYSSPGIPDIYAPRLGSVKFAYSIGAATFWSSDIDIKGDRTFIECPFSQGADAVVASPQTGVTLTFVPIRGYPLATVRDVQQPA